MTTEKLKTGTTCIGMIFDKGVILAADRRTTMGNMIASHDSVKLHKLAKNVAATHSGGVADARLHSRVFASEIKLKELETERSITVKEAAMIATNAQYRHIRTPTTIEPIVGYIVGGVDKKGPSLFEVGPDGTLTESKNFTCNGSGSIFIKSLLQAGYKQNISEKEAIELVEKSVVSAMYNDSASGGGIVMYVITKDGIEEVSRKVVRSELVNE